MKYSTTLMMFILLTSYIGLGFFFGNLFTVFDIIVFSIVTLVVTASYDEKVYIIKKLTKENKRLKKRINT